MLAIILLIMNLIRFKEIFRPYIELDRRSLALMRVLSASIVLYDLVARLSNLSAHYGDGSVMPPEALLGAGSGEAWLPFVPHLMQAVLHVPLAVMTVALVCVSFVLVGYRTRLNTIISWVLLLMIQSMNPFVLSGADTMTRLIFFFGMFLPWGDYFSIDRVRREGEGAPPRVASVWTFALLLQISFIYFFAALIKSTGVDWQNGSAVYYALSMDIATPLGTALLRVDWILPALTHVVRLFQLAVPFLLFFPIAPQAIRTATMVLLMLMHVSFAFLLHVEMFSLISIALLTCLLPSTFWRFLRDRLKERFGAVPLYYDGDCGFCKKSSYFIQTFFVPHAKVEIAQHESAIYEDMRMSRPVKTASAISATVFVLAISVWNIGTIINFQKPAIFTEVMKAAGIAQSWHMFSPVPRNLNFMYVADGITEVGVPVRVFDMPHPYVDERWRKYLQSIAANDNRYYRRHFLSYLCTEWNSSHERDERLASVDLLFVYVATLSDRQTSPKRILKHASASCD